MANLREELAAALPGLQKAVFSQPADKLSDQKVTVRPVRIKGKLSYQVERFRDNKAFHQNLDDAALLALVENELDGRYRQVLIVGERESTQYVLRQKGGYKKTGRSAALPRPGGDQAHNREKEYILREGRTSPPWWTWGFLPRISKSSAPSTTSISRSTALWSWWIRN